MTPVGGRSEPGDREPRRPVHPVLGGFVFLVFAGILGVSAAWDAHHSGAGHNLSGMRAAEIAFGAALVILLAIIGVLFVRTGSASHPIPRAGGRRPGLVISIVTLGIVAETALSNFLLAIVEGAASGAALALAVGIPIYLTHQARFQRDTLHSGEPPTPPS